jgi:hypothetical protein
MVELMAIRLRWPTPTSIMTMSSAQKAQFKRRRHEQAPIEARVQAWRQGRDGLSALYNGLRVSIPRNKLAQLAATTGEGSTHHSLKDI